MDEFDLRTLMPAVEEAHKVPSFLRRMLFGEEIPHETNIIQLDFVKGGREMAAYVSPLLQGKPVRKSGYKTTYIEPPYIKEKDATTAFHLLKRAAGVSPYAGGQRVARFLEIVAKTSRTLIERIDRRIEYQCGQAVTTGHVIATGEGQSIDVDYGIDATHLPVLSVAEKKWSHADSNPLDDLNTWIKLIADDSGVQPNIVIMGLDVYAAFMKHPSIVGTSSLFNLLRVSLGQLNPTILEEGVKYVGYITDLGCDVYVYSALVTDPITNATADVFDKKKVLITNTNVKYRIHYGAIQDLDALGIGNPAESMLSPSNNMFYMARYFLKSWEEKDPSTHIILSQSAPLAAIEQPNALVCATVL